MRKKEQQPQQELPDIEHLDIEQPITEESTTEFITEEAITEVETSEQPITEEAINKPESPESPDNSEDPENSEFPDNQESPESSESPAIPDFRLSEAFSFLTADDQEAVGGWLDSLISQLSGNALTSDTLQAVLHAIHYDRDVTQAGIDGEVRGRNTRIEELFEQKRKTADIHVLGGAIAHANTTPPANIIGGLSAADRQTIWERGNEKRFILR